METRFGDVLLIEELHHLLILHLIPISCNFVAEVVMVVQERVTFIKSIGVQVQALGPDSRGQLQLRFTVHNKTLVRSTRREERTRVILPR